MLISKYGEEKGVEARSRRKGSRWWLDMMSLEGADMGVLNCGRGYGCGCVASRILR